MEWRLWKRWFPASMVDRPQRLMDRPSALQSPLSAYMAGITSPVLRTAQTWLARLSVREQWLVGAAALITGVLLGYLLVIEPIWEARVGGQARVAAKERELEEVLALQRRYQSLQQTARRTQVKHAPEVSPFTFLEHVTSQTLGREKVSAINPTQHETQAGLKRETIEVQLQGVSLRQLVELLHKINTASVTLQTTRLSIKKRYKDPYSFDVFLTALALSAE